MPGKLGLLMQSSDSSRGHRDGARPGHSSMDISCLPHAAVGRCSSVPAVFGVKGALCSLSPWHCSPGVPRHTARWAGDTGGVTGVSPPAKTPPALTGTPAQVATSRQFWCQMTNDCQRRQIWGSGAPSKSSSSKNYLWLSPKVSV